MVSHAVLFCGVSAVLRGFSLPDEERQQEKANDDGGVEAVEDPALLRRDPEGS